ncbi:MAG: type IV secretory system conjugative DNA transfer family protein, partial [Pseudomonadota bacterium]
MSSTFEPASKYRYEEGALFLGAARCDNQGSTKQYFPVGIKTERHAITFAGSGAGKGAAVLIPNAKLWPQNLLVIDPKGEVAAATAKVREAKGQNVYVVDPFLQAQIDDKYR